MLTSAVSSSVSSAVSSVVSSAASSSAASSTTVMVTGITVASVLVAVVLFLALLGRETAVSMAEDGSNLDLHPFNVVLAPLAIAFVLNIAIETLIVLNVL